MNAVTQQMIDDDPCPGGGAIDALLRVSLYTIGYALQPENYMSFFEYGRKHHDKVSDKNRHETECPFCNNQPAVLARSLNAARILVETYNP